MDIRDRLASRSRCAQQSRERVCGVRVMRLVRTRLPSRPKDPLHLRVDHCLHRAANLRRQPEVSFDHPVVRGPHPEPANRMLPRRTSTWILRLCACEHARVLQRRHPLTRGFQECRLRARVTRRRVGDQLRLARRQLAFPYRGGGRGQPFQSLRRRDRSTRITRIGPHGFRKEVRSVTSAARRVRRRLLDPFRRLPQHPIRQPTNHTQFRNDARGLLARQRSRLEPARQSLECRPCGGECVEHRAQSTKRV